MIYHMKQNIFKSDDVLYIYFIVNSITYMTTNIPYYPIYALLV